MIEKNYKRWRLLLGQDVDEKYNQILTKAKEMGISILDLTEEEKEQDEALDFLYETDVNNPPSLQVVKWLENIQRMFSTEIVRILQEDALNYRGIKEVLLEPDVLEKFEPNVEILESLLQLKHLIPDDNKDVVKKYIRKVVEQIEKELEFIVKKTLQGIINKREYSPIENMENFDILKTIDKNLKNYDLKQKKIIADSFYFWANQSKVNNWNIIIDIDQSASMGESVIYASILSAILASVKTLNTQAVTFSTEVVNLSHKFNNDPVEILLSTQLGGGTDINKSVAYCRTLITNPSKTMFFLISDLFENGEEVKLRKNLREIKSSGAIVVVLLAITNRGKPNFDKSLAKKIRNMDIPVLAITPQVLPMLIKKIINKQDLATLSGEYIQEVD